MRDSWRFLDAKLGLENAGFEPIWLNLDKSATEVLKGGARNEISWFKYQNSAETIGDQKSPIFTLFVVLAGYCAQYCEFVGSVLYACGLI